MGVVNIHGLPQIAPKVVLSAHQPVGAAVGGGAVMFNWKKYLLINKSKTLPIFNLKSIVKKVLL